MGAELSFFLVTTVKAHVVIYNYNYYFLFLFFFYKVLEGNRGLSQTSQGRKGKSVESRKNNKAVLHGQKKCFCFAKNISACVRLNNRVHKIKAAFDEQNKTIGAPSADRKREEV